MEKHGHTSVLPWLTCLSLGEGEGVSAEEGEEVEVSDGASELQEFRRWGDVRKWWIEWRRRRCEGGGSAVTSVGGDVEREREERGAGKTVEVARRFQWEGELPM